MSAVRWYCAVPWGHVLLAEELGWVVAWCTELGAWMELTAVPARLTAPAARDQRPHSRRAGNAVAAT